MRSLFSVYFFNQKLVVFLQLPIALNRYGELYGSQSNEKLLQITGSIYLPFIYYVSFHIKT